MERLKQVVRDEGMDEKEVDKIPQPTTIPHHQMWVATRQSSTSSVSSEAAKETAAKIVSNFNCNIIML